MSLSDTAVPCPHLYPFGLTLSVHTPVTFYLKALVLLVGGTSEGKSDNLTSAKGAFRQWQMELKDQWPRSPALWRIPLGEVNSKVSCVLSPRAPHQEWTSVAPSGNLPHDELLIPISLLHFPTRAYGTSSQIKYLHSNLCFKVCLWESPIQDIPNRHGGIESMYWKKRLGRRHKFRNSYI